MNNMNFLDTNLSVRTKMKFFKEYEPFWNIRKKLSTNNVTNPNNKKGEEEKELGGV